MAISPLPTPPSRQRPESFADEADAFLGALPAFATQANALQSDVNSKQAAAAASAASANSSKNEAATSASIATTKAGEAASSAASALASANSAAASYDSFDDRYLGSKSSDPTTDNDGQTLLEGALYWNTASKNLRVWNGTSWQVAQLTDAPNDSRVYARKSGAWLELPNINHITSAILSYTTYAEASAAAATLPDGQNIEAPDGFGKLSRYIVQSGVLIFQRLSEDAARATYMPSGVDAVATTVQAKLREVVSVKDFGAVGDGVTDDTEAIQSAVNAAADFKGSVYVPPGDYLLTEQAAGADLNNVVAVFVPANVKIFGEGRLFCNKGAMPTLTLLAIKGSNVTIDGLTFDNEFNNTGSSSQRSNGIGAGNRVFANDEEVVTNISITNCRFLNQFYAINITTSAVSPNSVRNVYIAGNRIVSGNGLFTGAINFMDLSCTGAIKDVIVTGNDIRGATNSGLINLYGVHGFTVTSNICADGDYSGIQTENGSCNGVISGNFVDRVSRCIWIDDSRDIVIDSNTVIAESRTPPEGTSSYRDGILITMEGFTAEPSYLTTGIVISNNVVLDGRIRTAAFVGSNTGVFGDFIVRGNLVKFRDENNQQGQCLNFIPCQSIQISGNTAIGGTSDSISLSVAAGQRVKISGNITKKAGAESSFGLYITGDNTANVIRVGNNFSQGIRGVVGNRVSGLEYLETEGSPITFQNITIRAGNSNPEGDVSAGPGAIFIDKTEPAKFYLKATGFGNTGWVRIS